MKIHVPSDPHLSFSSLITCLLMLARAVQRGLPVSPYSEPELTSQTRRLRSWIRNRTLAATTYHGEFTSWSGGGEDNVLTGAALI